VKIAMSSNSALLQQGVLPVDAVRVGPPHRDMGDIAAFAREIAEVGLTSPTGFLKIVAD
jgi:hypothetical protein